MRRTDRANFGKPHDTWLNLSARLVTRLACALPVAFAAVGAHFLPFQWVYQTRIYGVLAVVVAVGPFILAVVFGQRALHLTGFFVGGALLVGAFFVRSHATAIWMASGRAVQRQRAADGAAHRR